jgi:hypothetical protein
MKIRQLALVVAGGLLFSACTTSTSSPTGAVASPATGQSMEMKMKTIPLAEQSNLGQTGTAVITQTEDGKAIVTLTMTGGTFPAAQPAHIHVGSCPTPGAVKYPLTDVENGSSVTTLAVTYDEVVNSTEKLAVNVHKSAAEAKVYTACGDVN